jgi:hypothetical protein
MKKIKHLDSRLGDLPPAMPDPTENSPKSCLAFSAAERADANPAQDALTQIPAVRRPAIISFAIWTCDRRAVTDAEKYFERGKDATRLYNTVKKKPSEQRKSVLWWDIIKHGKNPKARRIGNLSLRLSVALKIGPLNGQALHGVHPK